MPKQWPYDKIRELVAMADFQGRAVATLDTDQEARLFRFAIYNFRKIHGLGNDLRIIVVGNTVVLSKINEPNVSLNTAVSGAGAE